MAKQHPETKAVRVYLGTLPVIELMSLTRDLCKGCESEDCRGRGTSCGVYQVPNVLPTITFTDCEVKDFLSDLTDGLLDSLDRFYVDKKLRRR